MSRELPILYKGEMVKPIQTGEKTQTRRMMKTQPPQWCGEAHHRKDNSWYFTEADIPFNSWDIKCPYGQRGGLLWVRERHQMRDVSPHGWPQCLIGYEDGTTLIVDPADNDTPRLLDEDEAGLTIGHNRWRPSIHMPRWASRLTLEIVKIRVERLNDISEADAIAEGIERIPQVGVLRSWGWKDYLGGQGFLSPIVSYASLWDSINGNGSWNSNPWVWVVEFKLIKA